MMCTGERALDEHETLTTSITRLGANEFAQRLDIVRIFELDNFGIFGHFRKFKRATSKMPKFAIFLRSAQKMHHWNPRFLQGHYNPHAKSYPGTFVPYSQIFLAIVGVSHLARDGRKPEPTAQPRWCTSEVESSLRSQSSMCHVSLRQRDGPYCLGANKAEPKTVLSKKDTNGLPAILKDVCSRVPNQPN